MKYLILILMALTTGNLFAANIATYSPDDDVLINEYAGNSDITRKVTARSKTCYRLFLPDGFKFKDLSTSQVSNLVVEAKASCQSSKSDLHKLADTELVDLLIEAGDIADGSTSVGKGNSRKATKRLLKAVKGNGKSTKQVADRELSLRISQIKQIIISEGGDPDDAIVHPEI